MANSPVPRWQYTQSQNDWLPRYGMKFFYYKIQRFLYRCPALQIDGILLKNSILTVIARLFHLGKTTAVLFGFLHSRNSDSRSSHPVA
jgi:hypothetical protein